MDQQATQAQHGERSATRYRQLLGEVLHNIGPGRESWNRAFADALRRRGLVLSLIRPAGDLDASYPGGQPFQAPAPWHEGSGAWPEGSLVVWKPQRKGQLLPPKVTTSAAQASPLE